MKHLIIFVLSLFLVIRGATLATRYAALLADTFRLSKYIIGFIIVAVISILPETFIAISSALKGTPAFGLGTIFGSNFADLTLIFGILVAYAGRGMRIESAILRQNGLYPFLLLLPVVLGFDGHYSRLEGATLIIAGVVFYYVTLRNGHTDASAAANATGRYRYIFLLLVSMAMLLAGSHFVVTSATAIAHYLGITPLLIGMLVVGLGTTMPELLFSLKSIRGRDSALAVGDILGTVLADATIVVGIIALISPFSFKQEIVSVTGVFMVAAAVLLFHFMRSGRVFTKKEGYALLCFWVVFIIVELMINT